MRSVLVVIALAGCGRIGFETSVEVGGHDEDADGVADLVDVCPHLLGSQEDSDDDGIGDDCDPEPANPRQHLVLFATMQPGDQPLTLAGTGTWSQLADAAHFAGDGSGQTSVDVALSSARMTLGLDLISVEGTPMIQHQLALGAFTPGGPARYFTQLNQSGTASQTTNAAVTKSRPGTIRTSSRSPCREASTQGS